MSTRYRLTIYALFLTLLTNEVISLARVDNWSQRSHNTTQNNNWNYGAATQNPPQGSRYPSPAGNQWTAGTAGRYNQTYGNAGGQFIGAGRSNYSSPQYPTNPPTQTWGHNNQPTHYNPSQNQTGSNWNQWNRNTSRPVAPNTNWQQQPQPNTNWQQQPQPNTNWQQQPQPNNNWQTQPRYNTTWHAAPTTPSSLRNNLGWSSNTNNNYNTSYGSRQGQGQNQPQYTGGNPHLQNNSVPAWGANANNNPTWNGYRPGSNGSHLYPNLQPPARPNQNQLPTNGFGAWTPGATPAPYGGDGGNSYNNQWNGNKVPNTADGGAPLAPLGGRPGIPDGSAGNVPLAPLAGGNQWNAGGGGQAGLSYGNGQQPNSFGVPGGQQRQAGNGASSNPYSNMFA